MDEKWSWETEYETRGPMTCRRFMETVVPAYFATAEVAVGFPPNCPFQQAYVVEEGPRHSPPAVLQLFGSSGREPELPWNAVTVGVDERDGRLWVVEIRRSQWTP